MGEDTADPPEQLVCAGPHPMLGAGAGAGSGSGGRIAALPRAGAVRGVTHAALGPIGAAWDGVGSDELVAQPAPGVKP